MNTEYIWHWDWSSVEDCQQSAIQLADILVASLQNNTTPTSPTFASLPFILELVGELGAGKTTFAREFLYALGATGRIKSPSYSIAEIHPIAKTKTIAHEWQTALHCDFYRLMSPEELKESGLHEALLQPGLKIIEWAAKAGPYLPRPDLRLQICWPVEQAKAPLETADRRSAALLFPAPESALVREIRRCFAANTVVNKAPPKDMAHE